MACGNKTAQRLVQIEPPPPKVKPAAAVKVRRAATYHCEDCGHTGTHKRHTCPGPKPVGYQVDRLATCNRCQYAENNVCTLYKSQHPDRDCLIDIGVTIATARCPAGLWDRTLFVCPKCSVQTFRETGINSCPACKFNAPRECRMPFKFVRHDEPPLPATRDLAVVTIAAGQAALDLYAITGPAMQRYADKCGADFHAITNNLVPDYPLGNKFRLANLCANYRRVLFVDADVWIRGTAPNLFELVAEGTIGIHADFNWLEKRDWIAGESALTAKEQQVEPLKLKVLNTVVVLFDAVDADIWTPPPLPSKPRHLTEQVWVEFNIQSLHKRTSLLPVEFNTQWWMPQSANLEPSANFVHLANCPHDERIYRMRKYAWSESNR